jgi:hypothetical protein
VPHADQGSLVVMERVNRSMTTGCLTALIALIVTLATGLSWFAYADWHAGKVNSERRQKAVSSILRQARDTADETARSLNASHTDDVDALASLIGKHTGSPLLTYDRSRHEFTARLAKQVTYETVGGLLGGGSDAVSRCLDFTYTGSRGDAWTPHVKVRDDDLCRPATDIGQLSRLARTRIDGIEVHGLTRASVQKALDPTGTLRTYTVKDVVRRDGTAAVSVLITSHDGTVSQCYTITRSVTSYGTVRQPTTAAPALSC